jgi:hypothetical protein
VVLILALLPSLALAGSVIDTEIKEMSDATLYGELPGEQSNGSGQHIFAGRNAVGAPYRSVMAFDIAGNIPPGATIVSATVTLHMSRTIVGPHLHTLHVVTTEWNEGPSDPGGEEGAGQIPPLPGDCTWIHTFYDTEFWNNPGGDFVAAPSASQTVNDIGFYSWSDPQMAADVQSWLDNGENYGWLLFGDEQVYPSAKRFDSHENPVEDYCPVLTVSYTEEPTPVDKATWGKIKVLY